ncbi:membrane protein [Actimicrobium sp. GrIS 1.19]|uniref:YihY family inner membrane protein n=1 Tax=Actimicrobium sp. GrIS 1.19 TaxID=3071708 RepID=UPI002E0944E0|nr:membrane protein [Actimicrobium sp. GrIS 1.19]
MLSRRFQLLRGLTWSQIRDLFRFASRRLDEEHLPQVAGSLTFTTVLALVPLLTIALAIFTAFPLFNTFRTALEAYFIQNLMPKAIANTILGYLNQFAAKSTGLSAIGGVVLIITALAMMSTIERVFNRIWGVRIARPFLQRMLVYWSVITLGPLLIGVSISLTSYLFEATNGVVMKMPFLGAMTYTTISVGITTGAFTLLYIALPNRRVDWRDAIWGGLLAGMAFEIAKRLFAIYIIKFPTYTMVYGSVAAVPIGLLWIFMFWMITLSGALLAAALPVVKYERWWHVERPGGAFVDAMAILRVLYHSREGNSTAVDADMIRDRTRLGFDESETLLQQMLEVGWVGCLKSDAPKRLGWAKAPASMLDRWTLLINPAQLTLADVYRLFVFDAVRTGPLASHVENAVEQGLRQSLADYFDHEVRDDAAVSATTSPAVSMAGGR